MATRSGRGYRGNERNPENDPERNQEHVDDENPEVEDSGDSDGNDDNESGEASSSDRGSVHEPTYRRFMPPTPECFKEGEEVDIYIMRLENWLDVAQVRENRKTKVALSVIGAYAFAQLVNYESQDIRDVSFNRLKTMLKARFGARQTTLFERVKFMNLRQESETINEYVSRLKNVAAKCSYSAEELESRLLEKFASSIKNEKIIDALVSSEKMSWTQAVKLALTMEARERQKACNFRRESSVGVATVRKSNDGCYRCGKTDHKANNCKYENYSCRNCNEKGHLQIMCKKSKSKSLKSNGSKSSGSKSKTSRRVMTVNLNKVETIGNGAVTKSLNVGGNTMLFEVDTGAAITIINQDEYQKMSNKPKLQSATVNVKLADGSKLDLIGEFILNCKGKFLRLRVAKSGLKNSLLGRDFLDILVPNWREQLGGSSIKSLQSS